MIVDGGSAGWKCAAAAAQLLHPERYRLMLLESDEIGTVGVGEATLPALRDFNELLKIEEAQFMHPRFPIGALRAQSLRWRLLGARAAHAGEPRPPAQDWRPEYLQLICAPSVLAARREPRTPQ